LIRLSHLARYGALASAGALIRLSHLARYGALASAGAYGRLKPALHSVAQVTQVVDGGDVDGDLARSSDDIQ
ncbi:MAG: hypothetical protein WCP35_18920, partial [Verrucomicrobiota bacterium]